MRALVTVLVAFVVSGVAGSTAHGFGMATGEHAAITKWAIACTGSSEPCFRGRSARMLHGGLGSPGAVGAPDTREPSDPAAHCDDADFLSDPKDAARAPIGPYPHDLADALHRWSECRRHLAASMNGAVTAARRLLDKEGELDAEQVEISPLCIAIVPGGRLDPELQSAKCRVIERFGRVLHGAQDFHSHSNWNDGLEAAPYTPEQPPGLAMGPRVLPVLLDFTVRRGSGLPPLAVPAGLTGGCFTLLELLPGEQPSFSRCQGRITHEGLSKDRGTIDATARTIADPKTARGMRNGNFEAAVLGAIYETRRQLTDLSRRLLDEYGIVRGSRMVCAITEDDPLAVGARGCRERILRCSNPPPGAGRAAQPRCRWFNRARDRRGPRPPRPLR